MKTYQSADAHIILMSEDIVTASPTVTGTIGNTPISSSDDIGAPDRRRSIWN